MVNKHKDWKDSAVSAKIISAIALGYNTKKAVLEKLNPAMKEVYISEATWNIRKKILFAEYKEKNKKTEEIKKLNGACIIEEKIIKKRPWTKVHVIKWEKLNEVLMNLMKDDIERVRKIFVEKKVKSDLYKEASTELIKQVGLDNSRYTDETIISIIAEFEGKIESFFKKPDVEKVVKPYIINILRYYMTQNEELGISEILRRMLYRLGLNIEYVMPSPPYIPATKSYKEGERTFLSLAYSYTNMMSLR